MGKLSVMTVMAVLLVSGSVWANEPNKTKKEKTLSEQIHELLAEHSIYVKNKDLTARVLFTLDEHKRILVLAIKSDYWDVKGFLNRRLDKKKVNIANLEVGKQYVVDVRLTS